MHNKLNTSKRVQDAPISFILGNCIQLHAKFSIGYSLCKKANKLNFIKNFHGKLDRMNRYIDDITHLSQRRKQLWSLVILQQKISDQYQKNTYRFFDCLEITLISNFCL